MIIDTAFDFRTDTPPGEDPDSHSPTLRRYRQLLWSKPLPRGVLFELGATAPGYYLLHRSALGQFELSSDAVMASYTRYIAMAPIIAQFSEEEHAAFNTLGYTIGGMMVFPSNRVDGKMNINGARGFLRRIADRMDLTLESIRRHFAHGQPWNPPRTCDSPTNAVSPIRVLLQVVEALGGSRQPVDQTLRFGLARMIINLPILPMATALARTGNFQPVQFAHLRLSLYDCETSSDAKPPAAISVVSCQDLL